MSNILEIKNLYKNYNNFELNNINLKIGKGEIVGFIGENGAGKTTTIKSILNMININAGEIKVFGKNLKDEEKDIKESLGVILDNCFLPETLNAIEINKIMKNMYESWDETIYFSYLDKFNLDKNKICKEYSTGMIMKLKLIITLAHNPKLLILDEPTSGLDPIARSEFLDIIEDYVQNTNNSVFISSHITTDLEHIADRIIFISNGQIVLDENKEILLNNYGILNVSNEDIDKYKEFIVRNKKSRNSNKVLINDMKSFKKKFKEKNIEKASLEDIMLLFIKGEKYE